MYSILVLNVFTARAYRSLTYNAYSGLLEQADPAGPIIAVGAQVGSEAVGLALARVVDGSIGEFLSVFVAVPHRRQGIGNGLVGQLEDTLSQCGCNALRAVYPAGKEDTPVLERLFAQHGWTPPRPHMLLCRSRMGIVADRWVQRMRVRKPYAIVPWKEISPDQSTDIRRRQDKESWIPETLMPHRHESGFDETNSLALLYRRTVVGWLLTHRIAGNTIRYTVLFVRRDLQHAGKGLALAAEGIRRQVAALGGDSWGSLGVPFDNRPMILFVNNRLAPHIEERIEMRSTVKQVLPERHRF